MEIGVVNAEFNASNRISLKSYRPFSAKQFMDDLIKTGQWDHEKTTDSRGQEIEWSPGAAQTLFNQYLADETRVFNRAKYRIETGENLNRIETSINIVIGDVYYFDGKIWLHLVQPAKKDDASVSGKRKAVDIEKDTPEAVDEALAAAIQDQLKLDPDKHNYLIGKNLLQEFSEERSRGFPIWTHTEARGRHVLVTKDGYRPSYIDAKGKNISQWEPVAGVPEEIRLLARQ